MKKRWRIVTLIVGVLAIGIAGGTVLAQGEETHGEPPWKSFVSRVAAILGLEEAQVQEAFTQAAREIEDEATQRKLDHLVERGQLTQEQADEYMQWYQSRPEVLSSRHPFGGFGGPGLFHGRKFGGRRWHGMEFRHELPPPPPSDTSDETT